MVDFDAEFAKHADAAAAQKSAAANAEADRAALWASLVLELEDVVRAARAKLLSAGAEPLKWLELTGSTSSGHNLRPAGEAMWPLLGELGIGTSGRLYVEVRVQSALGLIKGDKPQLFLASLEKRFARFGVPRDGRFVSHAQAVELDPKSPRYNETICFSPSRPEQDRQLVYRYDHDSIGEPLIDRIIKETAAICIGSPRRSP